MKYTLLLSIIFIVFSISVYVTAVDYHPEQVRLVWSGSGSTSLALTWVTGSSVDSDPNVYTSIPGSFVYYGTSPTSFDLQSQGTSTHYNRSNDKYYSDIHTVVLKGLLPNTQYYYNVGDSSKKNGISATFTFTTKPIEWYAVYGDWGIHDIPKTFPSLDLFRQHKEIDAILHVGDIAYDTTTEHGKWGDEFFKSVEPLSSELPYMTIPGNHEHHDMFGDYRARTGSLEYVAKNSGSKNNMWYSFNQDKIHFIMFDTEISQYPLDNETDPDDQLSWLEKDLEMYSTSEMRQKYPWIISLSHKCDWHDHTKYKHFRKALHKYGVDVHFCGHQHNYQRMYPFYIDKDVQVIETNHYNDLYVNPQHLVQIVVGAAGPNKELTLKKCYYPFAEAKFMLTFGWGRFRVTNSTHLEFEYIESYKPSSVDGETPYDQSIIAMGLHSPSSYDPIEQPEFLRNPNIDNELDYIRSTQRYSNIDSTANEPDWELKNLSTTKRHVDTDKDVAFDINKHQQHMTGAKRGVGYGNDMVVDRFFLIQEHHGVRNKP